MAQSPCDADQRRYQGPARSVYAAIVDGVDAKRRRFRFCLAHLEEYMNRVGPHLVDAQLDLGAAPGHTRPPCPACGQVPDDAIQIFLTVYPDRDVRDDYWGVACANHRARAEALLGLD